MVVYCLRSTHLSGGDKVGPDGPWDRCYGGPLWAGHTCQTRHHRRGQQESGRHQQPEGNLIDLLFGIKSIVHQLCD